MNQAAALTTSAARAQRQLARRSFTFDDQLRFARMSGDYNPIHVDPLKARRTQAGSPVVHGVHLLLWSLDTLAASLDGRGVTSVKASFQRFVYLDEAVDLILVERGADQVDLIVTAKGLTRASCELRLGAPDSGPSAAQAEDGPEVVVGEAPLECEVEAMAGASGVIPFAARLGDAEAMFPALSRAIGRGRVAAIGATTCLVGMVYPGLHSVYSGLSLALLAEGAAPDRLAFRVTAVHTRFRTVDLAVEGGGIAGTVATLVRRPPTPQPSFEALRQHVDAGAFAGASVLVVGASRGLGELTAKLAAAGGAEVILTYLVGQDEAEAVAAEIRVGGGKAATLRYDASAPAAGQILAAGRITHAYYFATGSIFRPQAETYRPDRFRELAAIYVDGFHDLTQALAEDGRPVTVFYPSTVFVEDRPRGMAEYAMAKAAGETLCAELRATLPNLRLVVTRLPRLLTDQTAAIVPVRTTSALDALLPVVREVQGPCDPARKAAS